MHETELATHAYGGATALDVVGGETRGAAAVTLGAGAASTSSPVAGFADVAFVAGSRTNHTFLWTRLAPTVEVRLGRFVTGCGLSLGVVFGWDRHDYFSAGAHVLAGVDVVRFERDGAVRVLVQGGADALRGSQLIAVLGSGPKTFETASATLLVGYRMR